MQQEIRNQIVDINSVDVNLLCEICKKLTINPKECGECQHLFCQSCIIDWWKNNSKCPSCQTQISTLQEPHQLVLNAISLIKVKCFNIDCDKIGIIGDIDSHMKECEYNKQICKFVGCGLMFNQVELKDHFNICEYRIIICEKCHNKHSIKEDCIEFLKNVIVQQRVKNNIINDMLHKQKNLEEQIAQKLRQLEQNQRFQKPKCIKDHFLSWILPKEGSKCHQCQSYRQVIRYQCHLCNEGYCEKCKKPVFIKQKCPGGHPLSHQQIADDDIECDFCGSDPSDYDGSVWSDRACDFDMCNACYQRYSSF